MGDNKDLKSSILEVLKNEGGEARSLKLKKLRKKVLGKDSDEIRLNRSEAMASYDVVL